MTSLGLKFGLPLAFTVGCAVFAQSASCNQVETADPPALELISRIDHLDTLAREPMIVVHPDSHLFVSGFGSQVTGTDWTRPPPLWRSDDNGKTWKRLDVGESADGAQGNSDVDLAIGPDGTLYFASMGFNRKDAEGVQIAMGISKDLGESWRWQFLSQDRFDDRPWVKVSDDGTAHAIWNGNDGVSHAISRSSGQNWLEKCRISPIGGSSHLAVGGEGRVAVRISPIAASARQFHPEIDVIAVSLDNGQSWTNQPTPEPIEWDPTMAEPDKVPRWVEPLAWTADGALHYVWSAGNTVKHGTSKDNGQSWIIETIATETGTAFYPYLVSNGKDRLAASWFVSEGDSLSARAAVIELNETDAGNQILLSDLFQPDSWLEDRENKVLTPAGEYISVAFLPGGDIAVVSPIQDIHNDRWGFTFWRFNVDKVSR